MNTQQLSGPRDSGYGVVFREDGDDFYYFGISHTGHYYFVRQHIGRWTELIDWTLSDAIRRDEVNRITVIGEGTRFTCLVNDTVVVEVEDDQIASGRVGVSMQLHHADDRAAFEFDDFVVRTP